MIMMSAKAFITYIVKPRKIRLLMFKTYVHPIAYIYITRIAFILDNTSISV